MSKGVIMMESRTSSGKAAMVATGIACALLCLFFGFCNIIKSDLLLITVGLLLVCSVALYLLFKEQLDTEKAIILILLAGFILRLGYVLATDLMPYTIRQHDVHTFGGADGHAAYIEYFYNNWRLPNFDPRSIWQFYHPPVHHFLAAVWLKLQTLIGIPYDAAIEGLQFLTLFYASTAIILGKRIFETLGLKGKYLLLAVTIITFSPAFTLFAGSVNNDILSVVFLLASVLAVLKWNKSGKLSHLLQVAAFIGIGMSVKTSVAIVAFPVAVLMLLKFFKHKDKIKTIVHYALFGVVVFPLGLWWPVRNMIKFSMPFNYVPRLPDNIHQYVGFRSLWERFLPFVGMGKEPYFSWNGEFEYNAFSGLFKSSAFGEYAMGNYSLLSARFEDALFLFTMAVCLISFAAMVYCLVVGRKTQKLSVWFLVIMYVVIMCSYLIFCYQFPHTCTMNIRYASPLVIIGAYFTAKMLKTVNTRHNNKYIVYVVNGVTTISVAGFALFSTIVYTLLLA